MSLWDEGMIGRDEFLSRLKDYPIVKNRRNIKYYNIPAAFDIEASSFMDGEQKRGIMYIWMFGIDDMVTYGRTWKEFKSFIRVLSTVLNLSSDLRLPVYIHNLAYEFQWIRKHFEWDEVFLMEDRKPVYAETNGVEFRCSLKLSGGKSLANVAKDLVKHNVKKQVGDLDYLILRTPLTPLTEKELGYCEGDIRVLLAYIDEKIEQDGDVTKIPLTNTGYVRQYCRNVCFERKLQYRERISALTVSSNEYSQLKRAFQGGFTHANAHYVGDILENIASFDLQSSYPTVMCVEKFPMSSPVLLDGEVTREQLESLFKTHCCMFELEMWNVMPRRHQDHPLSSSKCYILENAVIDNGRVVMAEHLKTTVTEQDYYIYTQFYKPESWAVSQVRAFKKQYLPTQFVKSILKLYKDKTTLKGVEGQELNYMISKNMINSAYGMTVTAIVRDDIKYVNGHYAKQAPDSEKIIEHYNNDPKRFLYYPWGVWVTAYARANLFSAIIECGDDYVYSDTDSVKIKNYKSHINYFNRYSDDIHEKIESAAAYHKIPVSEFSPLDSKGRERTLGIWDFEGIYDRFKTLGAKRYFVERNGQYSLTMAGVNKRMACDYLVQTGQPFGRFTNSLVIPKEYSKRLSLTYIDDETEGDIVDCNGVPYHYHELSSVHMEPTDYTLSMSEQFIQYLLGVRDFGE